jgi:hypothetical protein
LQKSSKKIKDVTVQSSKGLFPASHNEALAERYNENRRLIFTGFSGIWQPTSRRLVTA